MRPEGCAAGRLAATLPAVSPKSLPASYARYGEEVHPGGHPMACSREASEDPRGAHYDTGNPHG